MVCVPCFMIPFLLFLWRFIQPFVLMLWNNPKNKEGDKDSGDNQKEENYCPSALMCPCAKKDPIQNNTEGKTVEEKKED